MKMFVKVALKGFVYVFDSVILLNILCQKRPYFGIFKNEMASFSATTILGDANPLNTETWLFGEKANIPSGGLCIIWIWSLQS